MTGKRFALYWVIIASVSLLMPHPSFGEAKRGTEEATEMKLHHLHILLNQGISMAAEGSNLVMLAGMQTTPALDRPTLRHGQMMIANGRELIRRTLSGPEMASLSGRGHAASSLMQYSRELGEAMLAYMKHLEKLDVDRMSSHRTRTLQRMNIILNHSLGMASEGANLIMIARMGMAGEVDRVSLEHGEGMIAHAGGLYRDTMDGEAMEGLRDLGVTRESSSMMAFTLDLAEAVSKVIGLLARMPAPPSMAAPAR
ncbi:MAG: hypothetical protein WBX50_08330 [Candidatus Deferrimicrobiaceae bacterium]